jgi:hypothetical protein
MRPFIISSVAEAPSPNALPPNAPSPKAPSPNQSPRPVFLRLARTSNVTLLSVQCTPQNRDRNVTLKARAKLGYSKSVK